jgi:hypothetical protein
MAEDMKGLLLDDQWAPVTSERGFLELIHIGQQAIPLKWYIFPGMDCVPFQTPLGLR